MPEDRNLVIRILKEYYQFGLTQLEISYKEHVSKSSVNRILKKAKDDGLVTFQLHLPFVSLYEMEEKFKRIFGLKRVHIVPSYLADITSRMQDTARALTIFLNEILEDGDGIGVAWGESIDFLSRHLEPCAPMKRDLQVVQLCGSLARRMSCLKSFNIVENFAKNYMCPSYILPAPAIVGRQEVAAALLTDPQIRDVMDIARQARIALCTIGVLTEKSILIESGALSLENFEELTGMGAVSDILFHFMDMDGKIVNADLDMRTMGLSLEELKQKEYRVAFAVGEHKAKAMISALRSGVINTLYTDELTAKKVFEEYLKINPE